MKFVTDVLPRKTKQNKHLISQNKRKINKQLYKGKNPKHTSVSQLCIEIK